MVSAHPSAESSVRSLPRNLSSSSFRKPTCGSWCYWGGVIAAVILILFESVVWTLDTTDEIQAFDIPFDMVPPPMLVQRQPVHPRSVYVPGAGFSGFWYSLGRLAAIPDPSSMIYHCFSAGCLASVATLTGQGLDDVMQLAVGAQLRWRTGKIDRFEVVEEFVDGLLGLRTDTFGLNWTDATTVVGISVTRNITRPCTHIGSCRQRILMDDPKLLSSLRVVTTAKDVDGFRHAIRAPNSVEELREMLVQTTWIPFATGPGMWAVDSQTGVRHLDGGFTAAAHPRCMYRLGLPLTNIRLLLNVLNVNMNPLQAKKFW
eukprot:CAMPEP_0183316098 /NCGR_PEP_ID=MMETSP0160_2-20130417/53838_1 /TAXON_ID=2839 ORGANISM="Odontella Sinensis, Strain Grunow 1884" /NCGR_SAMPLE_ID=MMETSP0160_2 /ASSEMBLY_ACC=CAM_ASM_000250 /LENGTH=315 /DNA_ID=CAMNT_0025481811 /DNA_START=1 /DNA_END=945 /DNA_ORIENTATION=-